MKAFRTKTGRGRASRSEIPSACESGTAGPTDAAPALSAAERHRLIAESAYRLAAARGFAGDQALADWLAAEREVDARTAASYTSLAPPSGP